MSNRKVEAARKAVQFALRSGQHIKGVSAEVVGCALSELHAQHGSLSPSAVLEAARPEASPLHPVFQWNNDKAAEEYRMWQARELIRNVRVVREGGDSVAAFVHVDKHYVSTEVVVGRPDLFSLALAQLIAKVRSAEASVAELRHYAEEQPDADGERLGRIAIAMQAMQTASAAVAALH